MSDEIRKYLVESQQGKKGHTFYVNGNTVDGYVVRIIDDHTVEIRNQTSSKALVLLDRLEAITMS